MDRRLSPVKHGYWRFGWVLCGCVLFLSGCAGWHTTPYVEIEHVSNIACGPAPSFGIDCDETDWNSYGAGWRATHANGVYFDLKAADQIGDRELEGIGPHAYWKLGYEFR